MRLITPYAPGSFLTPCLIVSTLYVEGCRETAVLFVEALNTDHALGQAFGGMRPDRLKNSDWVVIRQHEQREDAIAYHLAIVTPFKNGGSQAEWDEGWEPYLALFEQWCPAEIKKGQP